MPNDGSTRIGSSRRLVPMAGVTDRAYRRIMREFGADYAVTEMVSAKAVVYGDRKSLTLADLSEEIRPVGVQLFGSVPADFAAAAAILLENGIHPDVFEINAGCPMPKIVKSGAGCSLMRDGGATLADIIAALTAELDKNKSSVTPRIAVTAKIRAGWDNINAAEVAKRAEHAGVSAITVHGRTREQLYGGVADLDVIKAVKASVTVPVIGNGDIRDCASAARMLTYTGCDGIAVGRGSYGNPWLFASLIAGRDYVPGFDERIAVMERHIRLLIADKGEYIAMREARRVAGYYLRGLRYAAALRRECGSLATVSDFDWLLSKLRSSGSINQGSI